MQKYIFPNTQVETLSVDSLMQTQVVSNPVIGDIGENASGNPDDVVIK